MPRLLNILLVIGVASASAYSVKLRHQLEAERARGQEQDTQVQALTDRVRALEKQLAQEKQKNQQEIGTELSRVVDLKNKLAAQKDIVNQAKQRLEDAKANARTGDDPASLRESMKQEKAYIDELSRQLQLAHQKESELNAQGKSDSEQLRWQKSQSDMSLNAQIQAQQQVIQDTNQKLNELKGRRDYIGRQQIQDLQNQLKEEKTALDQLKNQKKYYGEQWKGESVAHSSNQQQQKQSIQQSESQIKTMLEQEKARYQTMQSQANSFQKGQDSRQAQIKALESDYQAQLSKAQQLENSLKEEEKSLEQVVH